MGRGIGNLIGAKQKRHPAPRTAAQRFDAIDRDQATATDQRNPVAMRFHFREHV